MKPIKGAGEELVHVRGLPPYRYSQTKCKGKKKKNIMTTKFYYFYFAFVATCVLSIIASAHGFENTEMETITVPEANIRIIYPKGDKIADANILVSPLHPAVPPGGGAFVHLNASLFYGDLIFYGIFFHSLQSSTAFEKEYREALRRREIEDGYADFWFVSKEFLKQKESFYGMGKSKYEYESINGRKYWTECHYDTPGDGYMVENITFIKDTRILIQFFSTKNCQAIAKQVEAVLSKIQFTPYSR